MKKTVALFLAFFVLTSHLGFAVGTHYCMGQAVESKLMLGYEPMDCGMGSVEKVGKPDLPLETYYDRLPCCEYEYFSIDIDDELEPSGGLNMLPIYIASVAIGSYISFHPWTPKKPAYPLRNLHLHAKDLLILYQVLLI